MFDLIFFSITSYQDYTTPLYMASQEGHREVVESLLAAGVDVNKATSDVSDVMQMLIVCRQWDI